MAQLAQQKSTTALWGGAPAQQLAQQPQQQAQSQGGSGIDDLLL